METLTDVRPAVRRVADGFVKFLAGDPDHKYVAVSDDRSGHYIVLMYGSDWSRQSDHGVLVHFEVRDDKVWVHADNTDLQPVKDLLDAGVPKDRIVLGFKSPRERGLSGFAVD